MGIEFVWDEEKNCSNQKKHGVSFEEAETIFYDDDALLKYDEEHSRDDERFVMLGMSRANRMLVVCHRGGNSSHICTKGNQKRGKSVLGTSLGGIE